MATFGPAASDVTGSWAALGFMIKFDGLIRAAPDKTPSFPWQKTNSDLLSQTHLVSSPCGERKNAGHSILTYLKIYNPELRSLRYLQ